MADTFSREFMLLDDRQSIGYPIVEQGWMCVHECSNYCIQVGERERERKDTEKSFFCFGIANDSDDGDQS